MTPRNPPATLFALQSSNLSLNVMHVRLWNSDREAL